MLDFDKKARKADYNSTAHCASDQQEQITTVWPCHEERGRFNAEGCNEVKDEWKETKRKTKTKVARQHR